MLTELTIAGYAVIDRLTITLGAGLTVLTGETGAGKSIILDALGLLLGDRADATAVRAGQDRALVEGIFELSQAQADRVAQMLDLELEEPELILSREVRAGGRSTCRINGRAFPRSRLAEVGSLLVDVHGQSEHLSLLRPAEHINLLDRYAGLGGLRSDYAAVLASLRKVSRRLEEVEQRRAEALERRELLEFQAGEIARAELTEGEEDALLAERYRRSAAQRIQELVGRICVLVDGDESPGPSAVELVNRAAQVAGALEKVDGEAEAARALIEAAGVQLQEAVRELQLLASEAEFDPARLEEIEQRLERIATLKRKYGGSVAAALEFGAAADLQLRKIGDDAVSAKDLVRQQEELEGRIASLAASLASARREAARELAARAEAELEELGMSGARLAVRMDLVADAEGVVTRAGIGPCVVDSAGPSESQDAPPRVRFGSTGIDKVEFLISSNPGEPLRPLATVASGGETSRLMLALRSVLSEAGEVEVLVFDEIDAGLGGRVGEGVGRRLWLLGRHHQVLAITHLPQIASCGDRHLAVRKVVDGGRTLTRVETVEGESRVVEIEQMLGTASDATRLKAAELLAGAPGASGGARAGREG